MLKGQLQGSFEHLAAVHVTGRRILVHVYMRPWNEVLTRMTPLSNRGTFLPFTLSAPCFLLRVLFCLQVTRPTRSSQRLGCISSPMTRPPAVHPLILLPTSPSGWAAPIPSFPSCAASLWSNPTAAEEEKVSCCCCLSAASVLYCHPHPLPVLPCWQAVVGGKVRFFVAPTQGMIFVW